MKPLVNNTMGRGRRPIKGMTLIEVMIALFIFMVGVLGVLLAIPTGVNSAMEVILQDAAIHLTSSKFAEFRRDRVNPSVDLIDASPYMTGTGVLTSGRAAGKQEPLNGNAGGWRDFAHAPGDTYEFFDDIERYEWRIVKDSGGLKAINMSALQGGFPSGAQFCIPVDGAGAAIGVFQVSVAVRLKNTSREYRFTQYMFANDGN